MMEALLIIGFLLIAGITVLVLFPLLLISSLYQLMVEDPNVVQFPDKSEDS
jgi:hypothetical protein